MKIEKSARGLVFALVFGVLIGSVFAERPAVFETLLPEVEARAWLRTPEGQEVFASREMSAREAERFVARLYGEGALLVSVSFTAGDADGFAVELPLDEERRAAILETANRVHRRFGLALSEDEGQEVLRVFIR